MGFRGEALASIASVSKVEVVTKTENAEMGTRVIAEGGKILLSEPVGAPKGTTFIVRELFYNTPARYKFLKKDSTEAGYIHDVLTRIALARPDISIKFINQGKPVIHTPGNHDLLSTIYSIFGKDTASAVIPLNLSVNGIKVSGYIGKPEISRGNRSLEMLFVNGRTVYNRTVTAAIEDAYKTRLMQKRFPFTVLLLSIPPEAVDVNVHPAKLEVRFSDEQLVYRAVYMAVSDALAGASLIQNIEEKTDNDDEPDFPDTDAESMERQVKIQVKPLFQPGRSDELKSGEYDKTRVYDGRENPEKIARKEQVPAREPEAFMDDRGRYPEAAPEIRNVKEDKTETENERKHEKLTGNVHEVPGDETREDRERLLNARIIGQAFDSYIILEEGEELFLIDQHAAHERIRFEKIMNSFVHEEVFSQGLLSPLMVELTQQEMQRFNELEPYIRKLGFEAEVFGNKTVMIRAIPSLLTEGFSGRDFRDILIKLSEEVNGVLEIIPEETIYMMSCKGAIKANREMSRLEIEGLLKDLAACKNPYTCVHGRPVIISIGKKELERKFKRIV